MVEIEKERGGIVWINPIQIILIDTFTDSAGEHTRVKLIDGSVFLAKESVKRLGMRITIETSQMFEPQGVMGGLPDK